jgi:hypothetical protein
MSLTSLDRRAMLTPVTTTIATQPAPLRSHGPDARTTASHAPIEQSVAVQQAVPHAVQIGLDARTVLASVNAEAATAGNRTVLQTLAMAVATQINITRRNDETLDAFFLRIVAALEDMTPDQRTLMEVRTGLKFLRISLLDLSAALRQPDSPLAARLSAIIEAPQAAPQKEAADSATTSYLQQEQSVPRAAETLAMVNQAKSNAQSGLFSTVTLTATAEEPAGAEDMQAQLKSMFEPGIAETRQDLARINQGPSVLVMGPLPEAEATEAEALTGMTAESQQMQTAAGEQLAEALPKPLPAARSIALGTTAQKADETRLPHVVLAQSFEDDRPLPQAFADAVADRFEQVDQAAGLRAKLPVLLQTQTSSQLASMRVRAIAQELTQAGLPPVARDAEHQERADHKVQTLLVLKGIAEVIELTAKPVDVELAAGRVPQTGARARNEAELSTATTQSLADPLTPDADEPAEHAAQITHRTAQSALAHLEERQPLPAAGRQTAAGEQAAQTASAQAEATAAGKSAFVALDPVPFAYAAFQPAKDEFEAKPADEHSRHDDDGDGDGAQGDAEDGEARRERLARKAVDDLLRPEAEEEPELKITRDSSQADRVYALYQRMGGF